MTLIMIYGIVLYIYVIFPQLNTLRGYIMEDSIPSSAKHNTSRGLPLRDVLEYVVPDLPLTCLKVANNSEKTREHLCKLDEQGVGPGFVVYLMLLTSNFLILCSIYINIYAIK